MNLKSKTGLTMFVVSALLMVTCFVFITVDSAQAATYTVYSAKFSCGKGVEDDISMDVVKGQYATAINIHNPNGQTVAFTKKAVIALAERNTNVGSISPTVDESLIADQAMYVDCKDIRSLFPATVKLPSHIEGFLVISVKYPTTGTVPELDVWAKYTARHRTSAVSGADPTNTDVESINVVEVRGKKISR